MGSKGKPILYFQIQKVLYGLLRTELLLYRKLVKDIEAYGLQINPYKLCVENKIINDKQMTVVWHVDDLKVSHVNSFEITKFAGYLSIIYGGNDCIGERYMNIQECTSTTSNKEQ